MQGIHPWCPGVNTRCFLSSLCKLIWRHWTYKMPVRYILSSVWVRLSTFSQLSMIQYMWLCVFGLPIYPMMIARIYTLSYYHHQIGSMIYYPLFRVRNETMECAVCLSIFLYIYCQVSSVCHRSITSSPAYQSSLKQIEIRKLCLTREFDFKWRHGQRCRWLLGTQTIESGHTLMASLMSGVIRITTRSPTPIDSR